jgi:hypothetical protein
MIEWFSRRTPAALVKVAPEVTSRLLFNHQYRPIASIHAAGTAPEMTSNSIIGSTGLVRC